MVAPSGEWLMPPLLVDLMREHLKHFPALPLTKIWDCEEWEQDQGPDGLVEVWLSDAFVVSVYELGELDEIYARQDCVRLTVMRTKGDPARPHRRPDGITWDELQQVKGDCGRGDVWGIEIYPPDEWVINAENARHLWLLPGAPPVGWRIHEWAAARRTG